MIRRKVSPKIPRARGILENLIALNLVDAEAKRHIRRALKLMYREKQIRRAPRSKQVKITPRMRATIHDLLAGPLTMHDIADSMGLKRSGTISEIAHGKR